MTKNQIKKALKEQIFTPDQISHLDSVVQDAASQMASAANNDGIDGQLDFLLDTCGWTPEMILQQI